MHNPICLAALFTALTSASLAQTTFNFREQSGLDLEAATSTTVAGVTLTAFLFPDGAFNQTSSAFGINATSGTDDTDEFDTGEGFTFSFNQTVTLESLTVSSFGAGTSAGVLSYNGGGVIASVSSTGLQSLGSVNITSGTILRFESTGTSAFSLDNIVVAAVPEPSTYAAFAGLASLGLAATRRRSRTA